MNIFVTSPDPNLCAVWLDNLRVNKMILESTQMLCTALRAHGVDNTQLYKTAHLNHPCSIWVRKTRSNFDWLLKHAISLADVYYSYSYRDHACLLILACCSFHRESIPDGPLTQFANASPFKDLSDDRDIFEKYKQTMIDKWNTDLRPPVWRNREPPPWYIKG